MTARRMAPALLAISLLVSFRLAATGMRADDSNPEPSPATNFPLPALNARGNHCPMAEIPEYSDSVYGAPRIVLYFYDAGTGSAREVVVDLDDPACFARAGTRSALFHMLLTTLSNGDLTEATCDRLREAIRAGSIELGDRSFDLRPAQPHVREVCAG